MAAEQRRQKLLGMLRETETPRSGGYLAERLGVSRQIIVQDIAALRNDGQPIFSTPKGYVMQQPPGVSRVFKLYHSDEETERELELIVDLGGEIEDVFIYHKAYGEVRAKLGIRSRRDVRVFCETLQAGKSSPLKNATSGFHYHTVRAKDRETLTLIEDALSREGYLAELRDYEPESLWESGGQ